MKYEIITTIPRQTQPLPMKEEKMGMSCRKVQKGC